MTAFIASLRAHPRGFWFVFWGELAERASFYGMRTVLALYLLDVLRFEPAGAASVMTFFLAACYLAPLLGGLIADRLLGRFGTIAAFALRCSCEPARRSLRSPPTRPPRMPRCWWPCGRASARAPTRCAPAAR